MLSWHLGEEDQRRGVGYEGMLVKIRRNAQDCQVKRVIIPSSTRAEQRGANLYKDRLVISHLSFLSCLSGRTGLLHLPAGLAICSACQCCIFNDGRKLAGMRPRWLLMSSLENIQVQALLARF